VINQFSFAPVNIENIAPRRSSLSPNVFEWLSFHRRFDLHGDLTDQIYLVEPNTVGARSVGHGTFLIGRVVGTTDHQTHPVHSLSGGADFEGQLLSTVLERGRTADLMMWQGMGSSLTIRTGFWIDYLAHGRCAIDPGHTHDFWGAHRYKVCGERRTCLWCGQQHQRFVRHPGAQDQISSDKEVRAAPGAFSRGVREFWLPVS